MPIKLIRQNITNIKCDAIVAPTDPLYSHGGEREKVEERLDTHLGRILSNFEKNFMKP